MADFKLDYDKQEPNSKLIFLIVFATVVFITIVSVFSYYFFVSALSADRNLKQGLQTNYYIDELYTSQRTNLDKLEFINRSKTVVKIPITRAFDEIIKDYN